MNPWNLDFFLQSATNSQVCLFPGTRAYAWVFLNNVTCEKFCVLLQQRLCDFKRHRLQLGVKFSLQVSGRPPLSDWFLICVFLFFSLAITFHIYI